MFSSAHLPFSGSKKYVISVFGIIVLVSLLTFLSSSKKTSFLKGDLNTSAVMSCNKNAVNGIYVNSTCPPSAPVCPDGQCVQCTSLVNNNTPPLPVTNIHCMTDPSKKVCASNKCVECNTRYNNSSSGTNPNCNTSKPTCDGFSDSCVSCISSENILNPTPPRVLKNLNCTDPNLPLCSTFGNTCVECNQGDPAEGDAFCQSKDPNKPICSTFNTCVECNPGHPANGNALCQSKDPNKPICSVFNTCVSSSSSSSSSSSMPTVTPPTVMPPTTMMPTVTPPTVMPPTTMMPTVTPPTVMPPTTMMPSSSSSSSSLCIGNDELIAVCDNGCTDVCCPGLVPSDIIQTNNSAIGLGFCRLPSSSSSSSM